MPPTQITAAPAAVRLTRSPATFRAQLRTMVDEDSGTVVLIARNAVGDELRLDLSPDNARRTGNAMAAAADQVAALYAERGLRVVTS